MTKQAIIEHTVKIINQLPKEKAEEISNFAEFLIKKFEETNLSNGIHKMTSNSETLNFLKNEEDLYTVQDLKIKYNELRRYSFDIFSVYQSQW